MPAQNAFSADFQDLGIPDRIRGVGSVSRESRVDYLGDTHGNYEGFLFNMGKLGLIDETGDWIGKKRRLMLLGDIYGDRHLGSFQTAIHIEKLREQGARIEQLAGNHEDVMLSFFDHIHHPDKSVYSSFLEKYLFGTTGDIAMYSGVQEFSTYNGKQSTDPSWQNVFVGTNPATILERMRGCKEGQAVITNICRLQIGKILDDTLFIHTDPVDGIIDMLEQYEWDIEKINTIFRGYLMQTLLKGKNPDPDIWEEVVRIRDCFLDVGNARTDDKDFPLFSHGSANRLKEKRQIRRIIHGHSDHKHEPTIYRGGIEITSADHSSFKGGNMPPWNSRTSAGSILTNGHRIGPKKLTN